ncbi:AraC family transcriptional regulator [Roseibacillus persicicus]|uniref:AraC family transcriptional regulator n=1 Tax=Roseibacillus persicicus TaxID=454148 RepID=UPI00280C985A|nr:AraC family transcriptional regulator [Roseibacillus persicicus]MDQ8188938.1 AraC family transcriptional regulator [Roseibacillus persicicus]
METQEMAAQWLDGLRPGTVRELFEYLPNMLYFAKDADLRIMAGNRAFVQRCGFENEADLIGKTDQEIFPVELAEKYSQDDRLVLETAMPLKEIVEMFPNEMGDPEWFVTDKIPLFTRKGKVAGLCGLVRSYKGAHEDLQPYITLQPVMEYLKENYAEKVSVHEIAKIAGMSVRQLERCFRQTFKTTPRSYIMKLRILRACEWLSGGNKPITEIALDTGFYDHSSFSKKFSQVMGMSPRDYRKRFRNPD